MNVLIQEITKSQTPFKVPLGEIDYFDFGLFYINVKNSDHLYKLHKSIAEKISVHKGTCICEDYLEPHRKYDEKQKGYLEKYGNPHVFEYFKPHITIGHVKDKCDLSKVNEISVESIHLAIQEQRNGPISSMIFPLGL